MIKTLSVGSKMSSILLYRFLWNISNMICFSILFKDFQWYSRNWIIWKDFLRYNILWKKKKKPLDLFSDALMTIRRVGTLRVYPHHIQLLQLAGSNRPLRSAPSINSYKSGQGSPIPSIQLLIRAPIELKTVGGEGFHTINSF